MNFKKPSLEAEFAELHPDASRLVHKLDDWSFEQKLPPVVVTHVKRTVDDQERIYTPVLMKNTGMPEKKCRELARQRFSWHLVLCAVDLRNIHYTDEERLRVMGFLRSNLGPMAERFELLEHDVGRGDHIHIGIKDQDWRRLHRPI